MMHVEQQQVPKTTTFTSAPLRHRLRVQLDAPVAAVWALVGAHAHLPEYSAGIASVAIEDGPQTRVRVCHFHPEPGATEGVSLRERIRWEASNAGYATSAEPDNVFGLTNDLTLVTLATSSGGTLFTWEQYYDAPDLAMMRASFDDGLRDIGERLVARFGGRIVERFVEQP